MIIGVPKEIKNNEFRVSITPGGVNELVKFGHKVLIQDSAGIGSGITNEDYKNSGAVIYSDPKKIFKEADMILKVKEPIEEEYGLLKPGQILFTYLHLAANKPLTEVLLKKKITAIGYETVQLSNGTLPLLAPMSEIAGRMSVQIGANLLQKFNGGAGVLLGGVPGVLPGEVLIIGGGIVGVNAAKMAVGLGAHVTVMDINVVRLSYIDDLFNGRVSTLTYNEYNIAQLLTKTDLLVGAVLVPGAKAPKIVTEKMVRTMKMGSVIVDVAIDQGGSVETIDRITTHDNPSYEKHGVIHYSVANMPGAVPKTSTYALTGVTLPYIEKIAKCGVVNTLRHDKALLSGLNTHNGHITCRAVAEAMNAPYVEPENFLK